MIMAGLCGRIDDHPGHIWKVRKGQHPSGYLSWMSTTVTHTYWCVGHVTVEGGARGDT